MITRRRFLMITAACAATGHAAQAQPAVWHGQALGAQARLAKIDTQEYQKVSQRYGIRGIPALILFQNGRELARLDGARPSGQIVDFVRKKSKLIA